MTDQVQAERCRKLFASVVLAALDEAIQNGRDRTKKFDPVADIKAWARSPDGREVLLLAGIQPTETVVQRLGEFVARGVKTSVALARRESIL